jgi:hypothetical protein
MINAGILDGDLVVIRKADSANSGEIVVALVMGEEATLKRLRKRGASVALEAANPAYETRIFGPRPGPGAGPAGGPDAALPLAPSERRRATGVGVALKVGDRRRRRP